MKLLLALLLTAILSALAGYTLALKLVWRDAGKAECERVGMFV